MEDMKKAINEVNETMARMSKLQPKFMQAMGGLMECATTDGDLSRKTKELVAIGIAISKQCHWCIAHHVYQALEAGATENEIMETCLVAVLMGGGPALMHSQLAFKAIEDFKS
ncbi:MAG: carboxymuconolactone decarboxylase family protein [Thermodesulfobacteriota bacterium]|nr:carboxymuconolactone decarboxylase family protein [Thermodesulfobacteriota bacterium]